MIKPSGRKKSYHAWWDMHHRCSDASNTHYKYYGGRGISVCERWGEFSCFYEDMGDPPAGHSLDRINNDGNYEPGNCRWATRVQQARNSRLVRLLTYGGCTATVTDWALALGITQSALSHRIKKRGVEGAIRMGNKYGIQP
jgi:hypothetical protein